MRIAFGLGLVLLAAAPRRLDAHLHLVRSVPAADSAATTAVRSILLVFSERPEAAFTRIRLFAADSTEIPVGAVGVVAGDSMAVTASLTRRIAAGRYTVRWQTAGRDGHVIRGEFAFTAPGDPEPDTLTTAAADTADSRSDTPGGFPLGIVAIAGAAALAAVFLLRSRR